MRAGKKTDREPINGILLLDKSAGISSNCALQTAKRLLNARKAGHTGTLDPIATGVLLICFGQATKVSSMFLNSDKRYVMTVKLGVTTDSGDKEGNILAAKPVDVSEEEIRNAISEFTGEIEQVPPMYSALKINGQPLYKLARKGIEVERKPRTATVYELNLLEVREHRISLEVHCSKGFYVRSLAADLGAALGCGGHVDSLRRLSVGKFNIEKCITIEQLEVLESAKIRQKLLIPADKALSHLPKIDLPENIAQNFCRGQSVRTPQCPENRLVRLYSENNRFLGLGEVIERGRVAPKRVFV